MTDRSLHIRQYEPDAHPGWLRMRAAIAAPLAFLLLACERAPSPERAPAAGAADSAAIVAPDTAAPRFEDYPVAERYSGPAAPVDLASDTIARRFRTALTRGAADTVDFAGRFRVVLWGCGTECQSGAIVDAASGRVNGLPGVLSVGAAYRVDSRLFVVNPPGAIRAAHGEEAPARLRPRYYLWNDTGFVALDGHDRH